MKRATVIALTLSSSFFLAGCPDDKQAEETKTSISDAIGEAVDEAGDALEETMDAAGEAVEEAAEKVEEAVDEAVDGEG